MARRDERRPGTGTGAAPKQVGETETTVTDEAPLYPAGGDPVRAMRMHHRFVRRRRWSRELDRIIERMAA